MKAVPRRVDWRSVEDSRVWILGAEGRSNRYIQLETGLSPCQVTYRLRAGGVKLADYRNGTTTLSEQQQAAMRPVTEAHFKRVFLRSRK